MKNSLLFIAFCGILLFSSCARHIIVNYQDSSENTGTIIYSPTTALQGAVMTVDDKLLVDKKVVKKVTIKNVPVGTHKVHFSADSWAYKDKLDQTDSIKIVKDAEVAKIVNTPPYGTGYYVVYGISSLVSLITTLIIFR